MSLASSVSRQSAITHGDAFYLGDLCKNGHGAPEDETKSMRDTKRRECVVCRSVRVQNKTRAERLALAKETGSIAENIPDRPAHVRMDWPNRWGRFEDDPRADSSGFRVLIRSKGALVA